MIRTPRYYRHFSLTLGKAHTLFQNSTHLIQTPNNADDGHLVLAQWTDSRRIKVNLANADTFVL